MNDKVKNALQCWLMEREEKFGACKILVLTGWGKSSYHKYRNTWEDIEPDYHENPKWDESSPYPKVGYQVFYRMDIEKLHDFEAKYESAERILINPSEVIEYYHDWNELYQEILNHATN
jgi:hypothetical protein